VYTVRLWMTTHVTTHVWLTSSPVTTLGANRRARRPRFPTPAPSPVLLLQLLLLHRLQLLLEKFISRVVLPDYSNLHTRCRVTRQRQT
jgi:hypothetical protein